MEIASTRDYGGERWSRLEWGVLFGVPSQVKDRMQDDLRKVHKLGLKGF